jgi:hypothetical protein
VRRLLAYRWLAVVVSIVLVVVIGFEIRALGDDGSDVPEVPDRTVGVTRDFAVAVTSFDHKRIDADLKRVLSFGDRGFAREFRAAMGDDFVEGIESGKRVSVGRVLYGPTVQRVGDGTASLFVVVGQRIAAEGQTEDPPRSLTVRMLVTVSTGSDPKVKTVEVL